MSALFLLDQINFMADKILNFSVEYVSFSSLIPDAMNPIFFMSHYPANIYLLIFTCSKSKIETLEKV